ncbi:MAG TPA: MarR family transcriptional regulator [Candidatus Binatia bacterium]|nr:MarR family transcriptional regulator [Candidatus Binatia bacterium]
MPRESPHKALDPPHASERALTALVHLLASVEAVEFRRWGDLGLTISQLRVLHLLRERRFSCGQVADHLGITASTATALIERLVRRGLVERITRDGDRRVTDLRLSEPGRRLLEETYRRKTGVITASVLELSGDDRERLADLLDRLAAAVQARESWTDAESATDAAGERGAEASAAVTGRRREPAGTQA